MTGRPLTLEELQSSSAGSACPGMPVRTVCVCDQLIYWDLRLQMWVHVDGWVNCP